jgi:energy-coupling factor transporter ATP-binding protein EcfA2
MDLYKWINESEGNEWDQVIDSSKPLLNQLMEIIDKSTRLPNHELQSFIFASVCLINPVLFEAVPIVWITGPSGTGKTTLMELANLVIGWEVQDHFIPGSTRTSVRNDLRERFFTDLDEAEIEERDPNQLRDGARLTMDNVYNSSFKDEDFRTLVITGYRRGAVLKTASSDEVGKNTKFPIYSLKLISSIDDCSESPSLSEMTTRTIFIRTDFIDALSEEDRGDFSIRDQLELDAINWQGFADQFNTAWEGDKLLIPNSTLQRIKEGVKKAKQVKLDINPRQRKLTIVCMATAYAFSDMPMNEIASKWINYWKWIGQKKRKESLLASLIKRNFMQDEIFALISKDELGLPVELSCPVLQDYFVKLRREGQIRKEDDLDLAMSELGYYRREVGKEARWILRGTEL